MKTKSQTPLHVASTYELLVHSEEKERSLSETLVYLLLIGTAAFTMWNVATQPFSVPVVGSTGRTVSVQDGGPHGA